MYIKEIILWVEHRSIGVSLENSKREEPEKRQKRKRSAGKLSKSLKREKIKYFLTHDLVLGIPSVDSFNHLIRVVTYSQ